MFDCYWFDIDVFVEINYYSHRKISECWACKEYFVRWFILRLFRILTAIPICNILGLFDYFWWKWNWQFKTNWMNHILNFCCLWLNQSYKCRKFIIIHYISDFELNMLWMLLVLEYSIKNRLFLHSLQLVFKI